jgi:peptide/nickel transport system substrate-binding protein
MAIVLTAAATAGMAGCGGESSPSADGKSADSTSADGKGANGGELRVGLTVAPQSLDPALDAAPASALYVSLRDFTNEPLIRVDAEGKHVPGLATKWRYIGSGNKTFEVTLRENVKFADGSPLNAAAVKKWLLYFASKNGPLVSYLGKISSITTVGEDTVRIHLAGANPVMEYALGAEVDWGLVSSPACVDKPARLAKESCGVGPYKLDSSKTVSGDSYTLVPDPNYYDKTKQKWSRIVGKVIEEPASMLQALQAKQLDVALGDASTVKAAEGAGINVLKELSGHSGYSVDVGGGISKPLADVRVRQAMNYAIDRKTITESVVGGAPSYAVPSLDGGLPAADGERYPYDPAKAKQLLEAAGYADGFTIDNVHTGAFQGQRGIPLANAVAKYLAAVGIKIKITPYPTPAAWFDANTNDPSAMMFQPMVGPEPMWTQFTGGFEKGGLFNRIKGGWEDKTLTSLFDRAEVASVEDQKTLWPALTKRIQDNAYFLPVLSTYVYIYTTDKVGGINLSTKRYFPPATEWQPK